MSLFSTEVLVGRAKKARTSFRLRTTPGEPLSMRKVDIVSKADGGALRESCNHEAGTHFLCHRGVSGSNLNNLSQRERVADAQGAAPLSQ